MAGTRWMARETNSGNWYSRTVTLRQAELDGNAPRTRPIARALSLGDIESSVSLLWVNTGKCHEENLLFGKTHAQLFCLQPLALATLRPGWRNSRKLGAAN